jgi:Fe-S-cluster containining protein
LKKFDIHKICSTECVGKKNYDGGCCKLEDRDYIIGPVNEASQIRLLAANRDKTWNDLFIDYSEGRGMFPIKEKPTWQDKNSYPTMRVRDNHTRNCIFYINKACTVYDIRPDHCVEFVCDHLAEKIKQSKRIKPITTEEWKNEYIRKQKN